MPRVMASWYKDTMRPLHLAGASSEMNIGATIAAKPTPTPPKILARTRKDGVSATAQPRADTTNKTAESNNIFLRPYLSAKYPAIAAPNTQPTRAELISH